jgi:tetratricopeptide (TPR) repeat protein
MLDLLTSLVDKSLAVAEPQDVGEQTRYRLLETVRQYARDRLEENGESETLRGRHQSYFAALAEEAEPQLIGPEQVVWLRRLEREHDNLRIALEWGNKGASLRMAGALLRFWQTRGYFTEGLEAMMSVLTGVDPQAYIPERAKILRGAGALTYFQGKIPAAQKLYEAALALYQKLDDKQGIAYTLLGVAGAEHNQGNNAESRRIYEESLALLREIGDKRGIAYLLNNLADMTFSQGDNRAARSLHEEGLALLRELGDRQGIARSLNNLGAVAFSQGDYTAARRLHEESLILLRELGDKRGIAFSLVGLALISQNQGDHSEARRLHEEGLALQRELGNKQSIAYSLLGLADVASSQCDYEEARALYQECIAVLHETGDKRGLAYSLMGLGGVEFSQEDYAAARQRHGESLALLRDLGDKQGITTSLEAFAALAAIHEPSRRAPLLWGAAEALREAISAPLPPIDRPRYDLQVTQARAALSEEDFNAAWSEGRAMPLEQAIGLALEEASS